MQFFISAFVYVVDSLRRHVVDDSWTGSERQVTFGYVINRNKIDMYVCIFPHSPLTDGPLCVGQSLCDQGHSSLVSFHTRAELFQAALDYVYSTF